MQFFGRASLPTWGNRPENAAGQSEATINEADVTLTD